MLDLGVVFGAVVAVTGTDVTIVGSITELVVTDCGISGADVVVVI